MTSPRLFLSCDWGTTSFRLRLVALPERKVLAQITEPAGVKAINARVAEADRSAAEARARAFSGFLREQTERLCRENAVTVADLPIVISGMASSTLGWQEVPYATTPIPLDASRLRYARLELPVGGGVLPVFLLSGLATATDIMRGEESEVLGLMAAEEARALAEECVVLLPGTHSKHVVIRYRRIVDFHTYMTGELFEVLATQSLLKGSVRWPLPEIDKSAPALRPSEQAAFLVGVQMAKERGLAASLFRVRARSVLDHVPAVENGWFLSGLLVGAELADLLTRQPAGPILLAATSPHRIPYELAVRFLGAAARLVTLPDAVTSHATVIAHARFLEAQCSAART